MTLWKPFLAIIEPCVPFHLLYRFVEGCSESNRDALSEAASPPGLKRVLEAPFPASLALYQQRFPYRTTPLHPRSQMFDAACLDGVLRCSCSLVGSLGRRNVDRLVFRDYI
jgi:hypothetical protein